MNIRICQSSRSWDLYKIISNFGVVRSGMRYNAPMMHVGAFEDMCSSLSFHLAERNYVVGERVAHVVVEGDIQILRSVSDPTSMGRVNSVELGVVSESQVRSTDLGITFRRVLKITVS